MLVHQRRRPIIHETGILRPNEAHSRLVSAFDVFAHSGAIWTVPNLVRLAWRGDTDQWIASLGRCKVVNHHIAFSVITETSKHDAVHSAPLQLERCAIRCDAVKIWQAIAILMRSFPISFERSVEYLAFSIWETLEFREDWSDRSERSSILIVHLVARPSVDLYFDLNHHWNLVSWCRERQKILTAQYHPRLFQEVAVM